MYVCMHATVTLSCMRISQVSTGDTSRGEAQTADIMSAVWVCQIDLRLSDMSDVLIWTLDMSDQAGTLNDTLSDATCVERGMTVAASQMSGGMLEARRVIAQGCQMSGRMSGSVVDMSDRLDDVTVSDRSAVLMDTREESCVCCV